MKVVHVPVWQEPIGKERKQDELRQREQLISRECEPRAAEKPVRQTITYCAGHLTEARA